MMLESRMAPVLMTSDMLSLVAALMVEDSIRRPIFAVNRLIQSLTRMDDTSTAIIATLNSTGSGAMIFWIRCV